MITIDEKKLIKSLLFSILFISVGGVLIYTLFLYLNSNSGLKSPVLDNTIAPVSDGSNTSQNDLILIEKVKKHILLPDETPKVVALNNISELKKDQLFFNNAKDGDIVLVYSQKVILYDPDRDIVLEVAQIKQDGSTSGATESSKVDSPVVN